jgi:hypothetical protein
MKALTMLLLLGVAASADELAYYNHHFSGAAVVEAPVGGFTAALCHEDFDPAHEPEIGFTSLFRLTLTPVRKLHTELAASDTQVTVTAWATTDGHSHLRWAGWEIEEIPADEYKRRETAGYAVWGPREFRQMMICIKVVRGTVLVTMMSYPRGK